MENTIENSSPGMFKPALNYALIISVVMIIVSLIFYLMGHPTANVKVYLEYAIIIAGLSYAAIMFRNEFSGGFITYGRSLGFIVVTGLITGIILGIWTFIYLGIIAPEVMEMIKEQIIENAYATAYRFNPNISDAEIDTMVDIQLRFQKPGILAFMNVFGYTFQALIFGLIISIFVKRKNPDFV
ncbi:MAG: DUF4199 domain-containing protein [Bacteroidales bacterium]|nr:DUF4199 domain-containing protein [Bacteroidales bacterium]